MSGTNLIIDIGNTTAKIAVFRQGEPVDSCIAANDTLAELPAFVESHPCDRGIVSTVIPLTDEAEERLRALPFPLLRFDSHTPIPLRNAYRTPHTLGSDRMAAAVGGAALQPGRTLLIIDAGTCITYELVAATGCYLGGNISPGLRMRLQAMHAFTGRLPRVEAEGERPAVGCDTETALRCGAWEGIRHEIEGYIRSYREKYPDLFVFLTGGDCFDFDNSIKNSIFADKFLVLRGLNCILDYNNERQ